MNTYKALIFVLLAWSTTQLASRPDFSDYEIDPVSQAFSGLDLNLNIPDFDLLFNEESADVAVPRNINDNIQTALFSTLTSLMEESSENLFFNLDISTSFEKVNRETEISLDDFITPSEEVQEVLTFIDQLSNKNTDIEALFQENGFFQSVLPHVNKLFDNFNEELVSLFATSNLNENTENAEEAIVIPSALSGIAFAMVDGLNGIEGEEEKGEENLEDKYKLTLAEDSRLDLTGESKSFDIYLGALCLGVALFVIVAVVKGLSSLRKHEAREEEDTSSNYIQINDE